MKFMVLVLAASAAWGQSVYSGTWTGNGTATYSAAASGGLVTGDVFVAPAALGGNDENPCTQSQPCLTPQRATAVVRGMAGGKHIVVLRGGTYFLTSTWTFDSGDSGNASTTISYQAYPGEAPVISGGRKISGTWAVDATVNCGTGCTAYYVDLDGNPADTGHYEKFESLFYNGVRRARPQKRSATGGYLTNACAGTNSAPMCVAGVDQAAADAACGCPAGAGLCAYQSTPCASGTPWMCFNKFLYSGSDLDGTWHGIALGDVELMEFEKWTMGRGRIASASGGVASLTGPLWLSNGNSGCLPGYSYLAENVKELAQAGQWYLDRCPGCAYTATTAANTWRLYMFAAAGEDPNQAEVMVPGLDPASPSLLSATGLQYVTFQGLTFQHDNWMPGAYGLGDSQGMPQIPAALRFTNASHITVDSTSVNHVQGWGIEFLGSSAGNTVKDSAVWDVGAGGIRIGLQAKGSDTNTSVPSGNTVQNTAVGYYGRIQPTGEGSGIFLGNTHGNTITHNDVFGGYTGGIELGYGLKRGADDGSTTTQYHTYDNWVTWNHIWNQATNGVINAVLNDFGGIYAASSLSAMCPTAGQPTLTPVNTYCNHILYNRIHDLAHNYNNTNDQGAQGIYLDQGASAMEVRYNLVYRIGHTCAFNNVPQHVGPNQHVSQYNLWENNIFAGCGARQSNRQRVMNRGGDPGSGGAANSMTWRKNIAYYNGDLSGYSLPQGSPGHWECLNDDMTAPAACTSRFLLELNDWWNVGVGNGLSFNTCAAVGGCTGWPGNNTFYTTMPWAGEDVGSVSKDPGFANPVYGVDDWHVQGDLSAIGFETWDYTQAGRTNAVLTVPTNVPDLLPMRGVDARTDFEVPCGAPEYPCGRTDFAIAQVPASLPNVGGLTGTNTQVTDPDFGTRIVRVTDGQSNPTNKPNITYQAGTGGSGDVQVFSSDSTRFIVEDTGGYITPYVLDEAALRVSRMYATYAPNNGLRIGGTGFFGKTANLLYTMGALGTAVLNSYDLTDTANVPSPRTVYDFSSCIGGIGVVSRSLGGVGGTAGDEVFAAAFSAGAQDTGFSVAAYKAGAGCYMWNTSTGAITLDGVSVGTVDIDSRFNYHNVKISKNGQWLVVVNGAGTCTGTCPVGGVFLWQVGTTNVEVPQNALSGHWTEGNSWWINGSGSPTGQISKRLYTACSAPTGIYTSFPTGLALTDTHYGWANADANDTAAFLITTLYNTQATHTSAWQNEVLMSDPVTGTTYREGHTFATGWNQNFSVQYAIGGISPDGKYALVSSDWMGTLGSESGGTSCIRGGAAWKVTNAYGAGELVYPTTGNAGHFVYQVTTAGTSGASQPTWNQSVGTSQTDGSVTWKNLGGRDCRGDVFLYELR